MALSVAFETSPTTRDGEELAQPVLRHLRRNTMIVDRISRRGAGVFLSHAIPRTTDFFVKVGGLFRLWWGGFMFRSGMTEARFNILVQPRGPAQTLEILFDGVVVWSQALSSNATYTPTVSLTGRGYADRRIVEVEVRVNFGSGSLDGVPNGYYIVRDAKVGPISSVMTRPWSSVLYFGNLTGTSVNALGYAADYLMDRINLCYMPLSQGARYLNARGKVGSWPIVWASTYNENGCSQLRGDLYSFTGNAQERWLMQVNGVTQQQTPTWARSTAGDYSRQDGYTWSTDLSSGGADLIELLMQQQILSTAGGDYTSRWSMAELYTDSPAAAAMPTLPDYADLESISLGTLQARLNYMVDVLNQTYSRITAAPETFNWITMFSRRPVPRTAPDSSATDKTLEGFDSAQKDFWLAGGRRRGAVLWVYGRGVQIKWGPVTIKDTSKRPQWDHEWAYSQEVIGGDKVELKKVYLDSLNGLDYGMKYSLAGTDIRFAAEELRGF